MLDKVKFPVIFLAKNDRRIYAYGTKKEMQKASEDLLSYYQDSIVVDSNGSYYEIEKAKKIGWGTILWGYSPLIKGRTVKIDLIEKSNRAISIEEFKNFLNERLNNKVPSGFWYNDSNKEKLSAKLKSLYSFKEIIDIFIYGIEEIYS